MTAERRRKGPARLPVVRDFPPADPAGAAPPAEPWYAAGIRFECQATGACCTNRGNYAYVYLIGDDEERLLAHLGLSRREFRRRYTERVDGNRSLTSKGDACVFLAGNRCTVYEARPVQCSTWPFWRENLSLAVWESEVATFCAGVGKGRRHSREEIERIAARASGEE